MPVVKHFKRRTINLDDGNFHRAELLAEQMGTSISGTVRLLIYRAYNEWQNRLIDPKEDLFTVFMSQGPGQRDFTRTLVRDLVYAAVD